MRVYICVYVCRCTFVYMYMCVDTFIFVYIYAEACLSVCACMCRCMFIYACMCVGTCLHVHMYMHVHGCGCMLVLVWRLEADVGYIPQFLSTLFYWGRVLLAHSASLASLLALGIHCLCFQVLGSHVDCHAHLAFLWIVGICTRVSMLVWWKKLDFFYFLFIGLRFFHESYFHHLLLPPTSFRSFLSPYQHSFMFFLFQLIKKKQINQSIKQIKNLKGKNC